jgi:NAD(P)-dependent dehydrogenase (short-subunit alcohol dehydrogenase family)
MSSDTDQDIFSVKGRVAVVTGASSGLGERFARVLANAGAQVVAAARRDDRLDALASEVPGIVPHRADLSRDDDRAALVQAAVERYGRIDVLVNNAGFGVAAPALDETMSAFRDAIELNLIAVFELSRLAAGHMIAGSGGSIINIASIIGMVASAPIPNASYAASKGGVINLTRELGCQWARQGVRVNAIAPGYFPSEATAPMEGTSASAFVVRNCPMGRFGKPDELDGALLFLASDASSFCTGSVLAVDGGWTAR